MKKKALGKGLGALFPENVIEDFNTSNYEFVTLAPSEIIANPFQPRRVFDDSELEALTNSIKVHGVIQPILVRKVKDHYEIVAGERRWRASKAADVAEIPALVISDDDKRSYELALVENIQRVELNPIEEAMAYETLISKYEITQSYLSTIVGKSRSQITNILRLLQLDDHVKHALSRGLLSVGHARALVPLERNHQISLTDRIIEKGLSVRDVESLINRGIKTSSKGQNIESNPLDDYNIHYLDTKQALAEYFGSKVTIESKEKRGRLVIEFYGDDDLERIIGLIKK